MVESGLKELEGAVPFTDGFLYWERGGHTLSEKIGFLLELRKRSFDCVFIMNPTRAMNIFSFLAGIPVRVGYDRKLGFLLTHHLKDTKGLGKKHEVLANLELVAIAGAKTADTSLALNPGSVSKCREFIAVHPFTSDPVKQWPTENFKKLIRALSKSGLGRVLVVGKQEKNSEAFDIDCPGVINMIGKTSLLELARYLAQSKLLISCNSGPVHLACCVDTPVVALFRNDIRGKNPERWGPWGKSCAVVQAPSLEMISVEEVEKTALRLIGSKRGYENT